MRNRGEPQEVCCHNSYEKPDLSERGAAVDRMHGRSVQIRIGKRRQGSPLFPVPEEEQQVHMNP